MCALWVGVCIFVPAAVVALALCVVSKRADKELDED